MAAPTCPPHVRPPRAPSGPLGVVLADPARVLAAEAGHSVGRWEVLNSDARRESL
jgi:hypothetical protein